MRNIKRPVALILIASMVSPAWAAEGAGVAPPAVNAQSAVAGEQPPAAGQPETGSPAQAPQQQAASKSRLTFMDSKLFDAKLSRELASGKDQVEIEISGRVSLNDIPPRIDRWVVKSAEDGKVELLPSEPKTRFFLSLIPMVFSAFGSLKNMQEEKMFDQATKYDTKIYYKKEDSGETIIEKIVMTKRKP